MCPITVIIYASFEDILVSFSLQRLNFLFDHCTYGHCLALLLICRQPFIRMHCAKKNQNSLHRDCLPILMLLYIVLTCLMLLAALFNAVCLYNPFLPLTFSNAFSFHALSWVIDT